MGQLPKFDTENEYLCYLEGPMTIDAEVHPKARTSKGIPGKIIPAVSAILPSMAANVSLVTFTSFLIRL